MRLLVFFLLFIVVLPVTSQTTVSLDEVKQAGLHIVEITTIDGEEPQGKIITHPNNPDNYNMTYLNKVPCRIIVKKDNETLYDSGPYEKKSSGATIRVNGNTSAYYSHPLNMPYKIKLEKAGDMLGRKNDSKYKDKEWRLLKDAVSLNTIVGLKLSQLMEFEWTSSYIPCNVIINGDYRGCYLLMESMTRNAQCRIDCDKQTGYIIEKDPYWWKENVYFCTLWYHETSFYHWTWKYPDDDDITDDYQSYIKQYIETMESNIDDGNYEKYIDITSFSKWLLAHDILGTRDAGGSNMYVKKYDNTENSRLQLPCIWDFDSSYEVPSNSFSNLHVLTNEYFYALMKSSNRVFATAYVNLWNDKKNYIIKQLTDFINKYAISDEAKNLDISRKLYNKRWGYHYPTIDQDIQLVLNWLNNHIEPLDQLIQNIETTSLINEKKIGIINTENTYYNMNGMKQYKPKKKNLNILKNANGKTIKVFIK